jgi:hypothetical protein
LWLRRPGSRAIGATRDGRPEQKVQVQVTVLPSYGFRFVLAHPFCEKEHVSPQGKNAVERKFEL